MTIMLIEARKKTLWAALSAACLFVGALAGLQVARAASTASEIVLHSLTLANDGFQPTDLVQLPSGVFYGITFGGPTGTSGPEIFSVTTAGTYTDWSNLCTVGFCALGSPASGLVAGSDGNLYTATGNVGGANGDGAFLKITPAGVISTQYDFTNTRPYPSSIADQAHNLVLGTDGNFYGTASVADTSSGANPNGSIYKVSPAGSFSLVYAFSALDSSSHNADGAAPQDALVQASDGNFYGTASGGGVNGAGTIFEVTPAGVFTTLYSFTAWLGTTNPNADGAFPVGGLVVGVDGNFYGTTFYGGANGVGTVFKIASTPDHTFTKLHDFGGSHGASVTMSAGVTTIAAGQSTTLSWNFNDSLTDSGNPSRSLIVGTDSNFYGATHIYGTDPGIAFQITPTGAYTVLHRFGGTTTDLLSNPVADGSQGLALILGADGYYYGTTQSGGASTYGAIYRLSVGPAPAPCTASGAWSGTQAATGSQSISQSTAGTYVYTLTCLATNGTHVTNSVTLTVTAPLSPTATLSASPTAITLGQSSTITWSSANATSCAAGNAWSGTLATSGTQAVTPTATGANVYQLTCTGATGTTPVVVNATVTVTAPPSPTATLSASPTAITLGQSSTLTWSSSNATSCTAGNAWSGTLATGGTQAVTPAAIGTSVYQLTCRGATGTTPIVVNTSVTVTAPPSPTATLGANPTAITLGQSSTLTWSSTNATACTAGNAWSGTLATSGTQTVTPGATGASVYQLTCAGVTGTTPVVVNATVTVSAPPSPTATLSANPTAITLGQSATLTWSSTNATACAAGNAWSGTLATSGTQTVTPITTGASVYQLTCSGTTGTTPAVVTTTVNVAAATSPTATISASASAITLGQTVTLTWSSVNATSCTAGNAWSGTLATSGTQTVTPAAGTSVYQITCSGSAGTTPVVVNTTVTVSSSLQTVTVMSGKAGGGGLGLGSLLGLGLLVTLRFYRKSSAALLRSIGLIVGFALLSVLVAATPVSAQDASSAFGFRWDQTYIGVRAGQGTYAQSAATLNADIAGSGFSGTTTSINRHQFSAVAYAGVPFYGSLSFELGYADLGTYPVYITTTSANVTQLASALANRLQPAGQGLTLNLVAPWEVGSWLSLEPRLGLLAYESRQEVYAPIGRNSENRSGLGLDAGLSALIHATRRVDIGAGVDCYDIDHTCNVLLFSAEIRYHFGK